MKKAIIGTLVALLNEKEKIKMIKFKKVIITLVTLMTFCLSGISVIPSYAYEKTGTVGVLNLKSDKFYIIYVSQYNRRGRTYTCVVENPDNHYAPVDTIYIRTDKLKLQGNNNIGILVRERPISNKNENWEKPEAEIILDNEKLECALCILDLHADIELIGDNEIKRSTNNNIPADEKTPMGRAGLEVYESGTVNICGNGSLKAYGASLNGKDGGAGIGASDSENCGDITISGNVSIYAEGGYGAAGIGGGDNGNSGKVLINTTGKVEAHGGEHGAGIGGGDWGDCGEVTVKNGNVYAKGGKDAAGIGGGNGEYKLLGIDLVVDGHGGKFEYCGGYVKAEGYRAIGAGKGENKNGSVTVPENVKVYKNGTSYNDSTIVEIGEKPEQ